MCLDEPINKKLDTEPVINFMTYEERCYYNSFYDDKADKIWRRALKRQSENHRPKGKL